MLRLCINIDFRKHFAWILLVKMLSKLAPFARYIGNALDFDQRGIVSTTFPEIDCCENFGQRTSEELDICVFDAMYFCINFSIFVGLKKIV